MAPYVTQHVLVQGGETVGAPSLPAGTRDNASILARALISPEIAAVDPRTCETLFPHTTEDVLSRVERGVPDGDGLFVYWTGHCRLSAEGSLYLALASSPGHPSTNWLPASDLVGAMTRSRSRDRLLILDTCLAPAEGEGRSSGSGVLQREIDRLSRAGIAVLSSIGSSPYAFAVNSKAPSVFIQQLTSLLQGMPRTGTEAVALPELHRLLTKALLNEGYLRPTLRNAQRFQRPVVTLQGPDQADRLPAYRPSATLAKALSRYGLAVAGSALRPWAYEPALDAQRLYRELLASHCGFTPRTTSLFTTPPSRERLNAAIKRMADQSDNMLVLYVVGHGMVKRSGSSLDLALTLSDHETVLASELVRSLRRAHAESVVLMLDVHSSDPKAPLADLPGALSQRSSGVSRILVEWMNAAAGEPPSAPALPWMVSHQTGHLMPYRRDHVPEPSQRDSLQWLFDFPDAVVRCFGTAGPLEQFIRQLRDTPGGASVASLGEILSAIWNDPLADDEATKRVRRSPAPHHARRTEPGSSRAPQAAGGASSNNDRPGGNATPQRPPHRRHRARLRVAEGSLPLLVGQRLRITFNYQPHDDDWDPRTDRTSPVDITLRIGAGSATVDRSIIHTRLTDDRGTPPEEFGITPRSEDPVTLRIDVVRKADGAMIQRVERVLHVAAGDGVDR
ncbi:hypothetical protein [Streptomyces sp. SAS_275]|uniref:hypothetical protein n=1 Tax=Streptomyces sp. SAS_275 TaxID=3412746 RepID=UPI00403D44F7